MHSIDEEFLDSMIEKATNNGHISPNEYSRLTTFFTPSTVSATRAKAFLALSSICEHHRRSSQGLTAEDDPGTHNIMHLFFPSIESRLADVEEQPLTQALFFIGALFAVDWRTAASIFARDGLQDSMMDSLELFPSSKELPIAISNILSSACGYKSCRTCLSPRCSAWLESVFRHSTDVRLKAAASLALLKSSHATSTEGTDVGDTTGTSGQTEVRKVELFKSLRDILVNSNNPVRDMADTVEGLAYLSTKPSVKAWIVDDEELLKKIMSFRLTLQRKSSATEDYGTMPFGLAVLIANLSSYRVHLTEEQAQIDRLRRMAQPRAANAEQDAGHPLQEDRFDDEEHVRIRGKRLVAVGAPSLLVAIARATDSTATRAVVGKAFWGLIEDKDNRGEILQSGGAKTLMTIIWASQQQHSDPHTTDPLAKSNMEFSDLTSIQALAKLAITASPMQVFGPNEEIIIEAIKPFACLLLHNSSTLLQRFEAMMALTNIASTGSELASRIASTDGVLSKLEFLLLEENQLVRRAATELTCNLVAGSEVVFNRFTGDGNELSESSSLNGSKSRLHVLLALTDVEDEPTRLAASGALAVLTDSPTACRLIMLLEFEHHRVFPVLKSLIDPPEDEGSQNESPGPGLVLRGVVCVRNILVNLSDDELRSKLASEAIEHGMVDALANIMRSAVAGNVTDAVLLPTAESLKWLMDSGVNVLA